MSLRNINIIFLKVFQTNQAKADAFAEVLADAASSTHHLPAGKQEYRDSYQTQNPLQDPAPADLAVNCPFTRAELETALSSITKLKVSEGVGRVSYRMLRELPEPYMEALLALFRRCWEGGGDSSRVETRHRHSHSQAGKIPVGGR